MDMEVYWKEVARIRESVAKGICPYCNGKVVGNKFLWIIPSLGHHCIKCTATFR